jgi:hypothetical protein
MSDLVKLTSEALLLEINRIKTIYFMPEMQISLVARHPERPDVELVLTQDDLEKVRGVIERAMWRERRGTGDTYAPMEVPDLPRPGTSFRKVNIEPEYSPK